MEKLPFAAALLVMTAGAWLPAASAAASACIAAPAGLGSNPVLPLPVWDVLTWIAPGACGPSSLVSTASPCPAAGLVPTVQQGAYCGIIVGAGGFYDCVFLGGQASGSPLAVALYTGVDLDGDGDLLGPGETAHGPIPLGFVTRVPTHPTDGGRIIAYPTRTSGTGPLLGLFEVDCIG